MAPAVIRRIPVAANPEATISKTAAATAVTRVQKSIEPNAAGSPGRPMRFSQLPVNAGTMRPPINAISSTTMCMPARIPASRHATSSPQAGA